MSLSLYEEGNEEVPNWYEHPQHGEGVDVAVVRIEGFELDTSIFAANAPSLELSNLMLKAGMDVHVLGFPRGIVGGARFPIWKRGSIASEPDIDIQGKPMLYIDTATTEGMSGAPVYAQESGLWAPEDKQLLEEGLFGKGHRFLGIYSGRVGDDEFSAQLGVVWKERAITEIIEGGQPGKSSFFL